MKGFPMFTPLANVKLALPTYKNAPYGAFFYKKYFKNKKVVVPLLTSKKIVL
jgi:hypothetical protein